MDIKKNLKDFDIKISKMASDFGISRPTLDTYIENFEEGKEIPNEIFREIFAFLFSKEINSSVEFAQKYDYVKRVMLKNAKELTVTQKEDDKLNNKKTNILRRIDSPNTSAEIINFINLFLENDQNELVKDICAYFNYANGFQKLDRDLLSDKEIKFFGNMAKLFSLYQKNELEEASESFEELVSKNERLSEKKVVKAQSEDIIKYIKDNISDSGNIDFDYLQKMIDSKED